MVRTAGFADACLLLLLASLAHGAQESSAQRLEIDACSLLSAAEIEEVVGLPVQPRVRNDSGLERTGAYSSTCLWMVDDSKIASASVVSRRRSFVILNAMRWPAREGRAGTFLQDFRDAAARGELPSTPVARKLGDEALWWGDGLAVRKGDVSFGLSVSIPHLKADPRFSPGELEERLASRILDRLTTRP